MGGAVFAPVSGKHAMLVRRRLFAGLVGALAASVVSPAAAERDDLLLPVQYYPPPPGSGYGWRRRPRCWIERRRVTFRDRFGRWRQRFVERRVCR
jgi:hypothetical protein